MKNSTVSNYTGYKNNICLIYLLVKMPSIAVVLNFVFWVVSVIIVIPESDHAVTAGQLVANTRDYVCVSSYVDGIL